MPAKREPGRPPRAGKKNSTDRIVLRVTEQEKARWERKAERKGLTLSEFARQLLEAAD